MTFKLTYSTMFDPPEEMHTRFEAALEMVRAPVAVTTEGQRAYDDLAAYYRDPSRVSPYERALKRLVGTDAGLDAG